MKDFKDHVKASNEEIQKFIEYVEMFYGAGGIYNLGATRADIAHATTVRLLMFPELEFDGDSFDREKVKLILQENGFREKE